MRLSEMLARSARTKHRRRRSPAVLKEARFATPSVIDRGHRQPKTKRSKRRNKVGAWEIKCGVRATARVAPTE